MLGHCFPNWKRETVFKNELKYDMSDDDCYFLEKLNARMIFLSSIQNFRHRYSHEVKYKPKTAITILTNKNSWISLEYWYDDIYFMNSLIFRNLRGKFERLDKQLQIQTIPKIIDLLKHQLESTFILSFFSFNSIGYSKLTVK